MVGLVNFLLPINQHHLPLLLVFETDLLPERLLSKRLNVTRIGPAMNRCDQVIMNECRVAATISLLFLIGFTGFLRFLHQLL